jgi:hypothetical protein
MAVNIINFRDLNQINNIKEFMELFDETNFSFTFSNTLKEDVIDLDEKCGFPLSRLDTTDKRSIIDGINEINTKVVDIEALVGDLSQITSCPNSNIVSVLLCLDGRIGDLNLLETSEKDTIVDAINSQAIETNRGTAKVSTQALVDEGNDDETIITPKKLKELGPGPTATALAQVLVSASVGDATETYAGVAELATQGEVDTGVDDERIITPKKLRQISPSSTTGQALVNLTPVASETAAGRIPIATTSDMNAGSSDTKAVTPLKLFNYLQNWAAQNVSYDQHDWNTATNVQHAIDQTVDRISGLKVIDLSDTPNSYASLQNKFLRVNSSANGVSFADANLIDLSDCPNTYDNHHGHYLKVRSDGSGIEFREITNDIEFLSLPDTPTSYTGAGFRVVRVRGDESSLEFHDLALTELADTPPSITGMGGKYVRVKPDETGFEYADFSGEEVWFSGHIKHPKIPDDRIYVHMFAKQTTFPANLTGSYFYAEVEPLTAMNFDIYQNATKIGEISFAPSQHTPSITFTSNVVFQPGDRMIIKTRVTVDENIEDLTFTLRGLRTL